MEPNELNALSALLAEDDFAKSVALGISAGKGRGAEPPTGAASLAGRALFQSATSETVICSRIFIRIPPASSASASAGSSTTARRGGRIPAICRPWRNARSWLCCCFY